MKIHLSNQPMLLFEINLKQSNLFYYYNNLQNQKLSQEEKIKL